jgi:hypothetical protein
MTVVFAPVEAPASETPHHHLALFAGYANESKTGHDDHNGYALGLEYELRLHKHWGIGGVMEFLGQDTIRNALVVVPVSFRPIGGLRFIAGPGMEFSDTKDKWALRLGVGYGFHVSDHWTIAPEIFLDLVETGERTWVGGLALGYGF